ncbi:cytochrome P450 [Dactylosporangium fulvum]|uniref:Cytochrome P450 n=1 Tax=Dactylosporangium fulvum TaxID=53359 RepID=A0ABY5WCJ0_9ACTN|nr:cytochrome P450 [Dactylosporangium fulvum]UWP86991.1 cytochrome P450 [Dactylosporangium fulvum]
MTEAGPGYAADPYPCFERLRTTAPVFWSGRLHRFVLTRYEDVAAVLHDTGTFSSAVIPQVPPPDRARLAAFTDWSARWLFFLDPPEHTARRAPLARVLSPRAVAGLATHVDTLARGLLAELPAAGFDLVADFAHPLAARVVAGLLCAPGTETDEFLARARTLERAAANARDPAARRAGLTAMAEAASCPRPQAGTALPPVPAALRAAWGADHDLVGAHSLMLLFAGVETTQNLVANAVHALLHRPGHWAELRRDRTLLTSAVQEVARFAPPVLGVLRRATHDVTLAGTRIPAGAELVAMVAAANRDPARFPDPDVLDLRRTPNPHLSFGLGAHYCPGAALTRLTTGSALDALLDTFTTLTLADDALSWRDHDPTVHGPSRLRVHGRRCPVLHRR